MTLTNVDKMIYLKSFPSGEPLHLIMHLEVNDAKYQIALDLLKTLYINESIDLNRLLVSHFKLECHNANYAECPSNSEQPPGKKMEVKTVLNKLPNNVRSLNMGDITTLQEFRDQFMAELAISVNVRHGQRGSHQKTLTKVVSEMVITLNLKLSP